MYHRWLDRCDERRAQRGEWAKRSTDFSLDAQLAFPGSGKVESIDEFCVLADEALADHTFFDVLNEDIESYRRQGEWLTFPSDIKTDVDQNNVVWARVTESGALNHALVVFHHWNATQQKNQIAKLLSRIGITVVEIAMPYHFERRRPGAAYADYMLSPSLGRTVQSIRQGVLDGRKLIRWLKVQGYKKVSVFGMSLGSWVGGIIAAHDLNVTKVSLFLTAGSLADMVWTGRATRHIKESLQPHLMLSDLRRAWGPLNMENFAERLARPKLDVQIVVARRDNVVLPRLSEAFINSLLDVGATPSSTEFNCGHYSLGMPPFILLAGWKLKRFLGSPNASIRPKET